MPPVLDPRLHICPTYVQYHSRRLYSAYIYIYIYIYMSIQLKDVYCSKKSKSVGRAYEEAVLAVGSCGGEGWGVCCGCSTGV